MSYILDNPGGGNCGPFAVALGLIDAIQKEYHDKKHSPLFERWQSQGLTDEKVTLEDINAFNLNIFQQNNPRAKQDNELLNKLQKSLRKMSNEAAIAELLDAAADSNDQKIERSKFYLDFKQLVNLYLEANGNEPNLEEIAKQNGLALSPQVLKLAADTAQQCKEISVRLSEAGLDSEIGNAQYAYVINKLKNNVDVILDANKFLEANRWFTEIDAVNLSAPLQVNILIANKALGGIAFPNEPIITINHEGHGHWTTVVDDLRCPIKPEELPNLANLAKGDPQPLKMDIKVEAQPNVPTLTAEVQAHIDQVVATNSKNVPANIVQTYKETLKQLISDALTKQNMFLPTAKLNDDEKLALELQKKDLQDAGINFKP